MRLAGRDPAGDADGRTASRLRDIQATFQGQSTGKGSPKTMDRGAWHETGQTKDWRQAAAGGRGNGLVPSIRRFTTITIAVSFSQELEGGKGSPHAVHVLQFVPWTTWSLQNPTDGFVYCLPILNPQCIVLAHQGCTLSSAVPTGSILASTTVSFHLHCVQHYHSALCSGCKARSSQLTSSVRANFALATATCKPF